MTHDDVPDGYCDDYGLPCYGIRVDEGIGSYEYWGQRCTHHDYVFKSHCCNATLLDHDPCCSECGSRDLEDFGLCLKCCEALV